MSRFQFFLGAAAAQTYTGSGALQTDAATTAGSGTFTAPVYTGSGTPQTDAATAAGSGTFTAPVYTGSGALQTDVATTAGSGTFTAPVYTGSGALQTDVAAAAGSGTFTAPVYTGSGAIQTDAATCAGTGLFATAVYSGSGALQTDVAATAGSGTFTAPVYTGSGTPQTEPATTAGSGAFTAPVYTGSGAIQTEAAVCTGIGLFGSAIYSGAGAIQTDVAAAAGSGTFTAPVYAGTGSPQTDAAASAGVGDFDGPLVTGSGALQTDVAATAGSGTFTGLGFTGSGAVQTDTATTAGVGAFAAPVYTGAGTLQSDAAISSAAGAQFYNYGGTGDLTTEETVISGSGTFVANPGAGDLTSQVAVCAGTGTFSLNPFQLHPGCPVDCDWIFDRVLVRPHIVGGTRVEWTLHPNFNEPGPYEFQLQFGRTANQAADDWENVGLPVVDTYYAVDSQQRVYGKTQWTHYRILLTTTTATYASPPQRAMGVLSFQDWRRAREVIRQELLRFRVEAGQEGYLLKRRLYGELHTDCVDYQTQEVTADSCTICYDTGFVGGYFRPMECVWAELSRESSHNDLDAGAGRGTVNDGLRVAARMLAIPHLFENDVWVDKDTDRRWYIHAIENLVEIRGMPIVVQAELRLAPFTDVIYQFPLLD